MSCYIVAGVTGTGKSNIIKMIKEENGNNFTTLLVDDLVTSNSQYKTNVNSIIENIPTNAKAMSELINSDPSFYTKFNDIYWKSRKDTGCKLIKQTNESDVDINGNCTKDNKGYYSKPKHKKGIAGCDKTFDNMLFDSVCKNRGIIYETTANSFSSFSWIFEYLSNYKINIYFTFLNDIDKLYNRNVNRGIQNTIEYLNNKSKPAPRFPKVSERLLVKGYLNYLETVKDTIYTIEKLNESREKKIELRFYNTDVPKGENAIRIIETDIIKMIDIFIEKLRPSNHKTLVERKELAQKFKLATQPNFSIKKQNSNITYVENNSQFKIINFLNKNKKSQKIHNQPKSIKTYTRKRRGNYIKQMFGRK
jgi:hypothetical protein